MQLTNGDVSHDGIAPVGDVSGELCLNPRRGRYVVIGRGIFTQVYNESAMITRALDQIDVEKDRPPPRQLGRSLFGY
jgi:hypothetical protein